MEKLYRAIFFWIMVILFVIIAPLTVLSAWGYHFDFSKGVIVKSGTISIKTNPPTADIYINGEIENSKKLNRINNTYNISGVIPKDYNLTVSAEGFQKWTKKAEVHSGVSSEFWNIVLVKNSYEQKKYITGEIDKMFISPTDKLLAYTQHTDAELNVKILNIKDEAIENTFNFPNWQFIEDFKKENIEWSPSGEYLSVPLKKIPAPAKISSSKKIALPDEAQPNPYAYFIADPSTNESFNLNEFLNKTNLKNVRWDPREKTYLFFLSENSLFRANIKDNTDIALIADNVSSYDLSETGVYYTQSPNELLFKSNFNGQGNKTQITYNFPAENIVPIEKLIVYDDLRIAFINKNNELFIYNQAEFDTYFKKIGEDINGIQFSDDGKKLLFWTDNEISAYFLRQWNTQPVRSENEMQNITRYSEKISNIQWFKDYEHIIFSVGNYVKIIELDARDHRNCMDILKTKTDAPILTYNNSLENLFFIDSTDDASKALASIIFPEQTSFFGL